MGKKPFHQGLLIGLLVLLLLGIGGAYHTVAQRIAAPRPPNFIIGTIAFLIVGSARIAFS